MDNSLETLLKFDPTREVARDLLGRGTDILINFSAAIIILIVAGWAAKWLSNLVRKASMGLPTSGGSRATLQTFFASLVQYAVLALGIVSALQLFGIQPATFIAVLGAASLAIGLALQSTLSNVAAGVLILLFRPYQVGDVIETQGKTGTVRALDLFVSQIETFDHLLVVIPNAKVFGDVITNFSRGGDRRVDISFKVPVSVAVSELQARMTRLFEADKRIRSHPVPVIEITAMSEVAVDIIVRVWAARSDYAEIKRELMLSIRQQIEPLLLVQPRSDLDA